jgi:hypothetical protein
MALLLLLFLFLAALTSAVAVDVREISIDEYINFVNPPAVHIRLHLTNNIFCDNILPILYFPLIRRTSLEIACFA